MKYSIVGPENRIEPYILAWQIRASGDGFELGFNPKVKGFCFINVDEPDQVLMESKIARQDAVILRYKFEDKPLFLRLSQTEPGLPRHPRYLPYTTGCIKPRAQIPVLRISWIDDSDRMCLDRFNELITENTLLIADRIIPPLRNFTGGFRRNSTLIWMTPQPSAIHRVCEWVRGVIDRFVFVTHLLSPCTLRAIRTHMSKSGRLNALGDPTCEPETLIRAISSLAFGKDKTALICYRTEWDTDESLEQHERYKLLAQKTVSKVITLEPQDDLITAVREL